MRLMIGTMMAAALVGCTAQNTVELDHSARLDAQARGVEVSASGEDSNVGMFQTTCDVNTSYAGIGEDYDYGEGEEIVIDGEDVGNGDVYLILTPGGAQLTTPTQFPTKTQFTSQGDVVAGQLTVDGFITVAPVGQDCAITTFASDGTELGLTQLGVECDDESSIATVTETGRSWVSTDSGVYEVFAGSVERVSDMPNALLSYDTTAEVVYAAVAGRAVVMALEPGGFERWSTQLDGAVTALTDMGTTGNAAVSVVTDSAALFLVLDGQTGAVTTDLPTPSAAVGLDVAGNGSVLAISLDQSVEYFDIHSL